MSPLPTGLLLPDSVLVEPWFGVFSLFVAFNTVIYLGLTLAKFVPWPAQVHPSAVRAIIQPPEEVHEMTVRKRWTWRDQEDPVKRMRAATAAQTIPLALGLVGALTLVIGLINALLYFTDIGPFVLVGAGYGLILIIVAQVLARTQVPDVVSVWVWTILMLVLVAETSWRAAVLDSAVVLTYATIALMTIAPISVSWTSGITGALIGLIPIGIAGAIVSLVDTLSWVIAAATAALASLVLLQLRLAGITRLAIEQARAQTLASTDPLTGAFSRTGLIALAPTFAQSAQREGAPVGVVLCDITHLDELNADYGFEYGGEALSATYRALRSTLPAGSLIARWTGSGFLGLVDDPAPDADAVVAAVGDALITSGVALGKRPIELKAGCASGAPGEVTLEDLVARATASARA